MDISAFSSCFGPPSVDPVPVDWAEVESWLGLALPTDYKALADAYGQFWIGHGIDYVKVCTPCVWPSVYDYGRWLKQVRGICLAWARERPPYEPPALYPAPGGLLPWAQTGRSTYLLWDTAASPNPDEWPVVAFYPDSQYVGKTLSPQWAELWRRHDLTAMQAVIEASDSGLDLLRGARLGPLEAQLTQRRTHSEVLPWTPPEPKPEIVPRDVRRRALTEGSGLDALRLLQPPPDEPYLGEGTWEQLYEDLGTKLPAEYVSLMETYGAGTWSEELYLHVPLRRGDRRFAARVVHPMTEAYRGLRDEFPEYHPLAVWPEPGGFLPFAGNGGGDEIGWLTKGNPDDWPVIVYPRHADQGPPLEGSLTYILLEWVRGRFDAEGFPPVDELDDPLDEVDFEPADDDAFW